MIGFLLSKRDVFRRLLFISCQAALAGTLVAGFLGLVNSSATVRAGITWLAPRSPKLLLFVAVVLALGKISKARWNWQLPLVIPKAPLWISWAIVPVLLAGAMILFFLPLIHSWTKLEDPCGAVGGFLPFNDALGYWRGANFLEMTGYLDSWNCRRPLNALLLAVRLAITGNDLRGALILQAALLGLSCFFLARTLAKEYGAGLALLILAILYSISWDYIPSTQSEALGLTLGTLATAILWSAARDRSRGRIAFGLFLLTLALNARAGAFLVLPALVLWAGRAFRKDQRWGCWKTAGLAATAIAAGFVLNGGLRFIYGVGFGLGHGNFAHTLYGLSTGHPDWTRIYKDHPEINHMKFSNPEDYNSFIYARAWENIAHSPYDLFRGYRRGMAIFLGGIKGYGLRLLDLPGTSSSLFAAWLIAAFGWFLWSRLRGKPLVIALGAAACCFFLGRRRLGTGGLINFLFHMGLLLGVLRYIWLTRKDIRTGLLLSALLGLILSGPIIYPDGADRVLVVSYPLFFLLIALAPVGWCLPSAGTEEAAETEPAGAVWLPLATSALILLAAIIGPTFAIWQEQAHPLITSLTHLDRPNTWSVQVGPQTPHLEILEPGTTSPSFVPKVRAEDFSNFLGKSAFIMYYPKACAQIHGPATIFLALSPDPVWVVGSNGMINQQTRYLQIRGAKFNEGGQQFFFVSDWQPATQRTD